MQKTVYYLVHHDTLRPHQWYQTRAGARIAQRSRNRSLGFRDRVERVEREDNWEVELCRVGDQIVQATWCIQEGLVDQEELWDWPRC